MFVVQASGAMVAITGHIRTMEIRCYMKVFAIFIYSMVLLLSIVLMVSSFVGNEKWGQTRIN